jgi:DNA-binding response OmpR family regulator
MGGARILLVDDEAPLLDLLTRYLERLGYRVDSCLTPVDALARFEADPSGYELVLTDLTLPGMKGDEMLARMRERTPNSARLSPAVIRMRHAGSGPSRFKSLFCRKCWRNRSKNY